MAFGAQTPTKEHWVPDAEAAVCAFGGCTTTFGFFTRRHHCRRCGGVFCGKHSSHTQSLNQDAEARAEYGMVCKVCDYCFEMGYPAVATQAEVKRYLAECAVPVAPPAFDEPYVDPDSGTPVGGAERGASVLAASQPSRFHVVVRGDDLPPTFVLATGEEVFVASFVEHILGILEWATDYCEVVIAHHPTVPERAAYVAEHADHAHAQLLQLQDSLATLEGILGLPGLGHMPAASQTMRTIAREAWQCKEWLEAILAASGASPDHSDTSATATTTTAAATTTTTAATVEAAGGNEGGVGTGNDTPVDNPNPNAISHPANTPPLHILRAMANARGDDYAVSCLLVLRDREASQAMTQLVEAREAGPPSAATTQMPEHRVKYLMTRITMDMARIGDRDPPADQMFSPSMRLQVTRDSLAMMLESTIETSLWAVATQNVAAFEADLFALLVAIDECDRADTDTIADIRERMEALIRAMGGYRGSLERGPPRLLQRIHNLVEDLQENMAELELTFRKKFGSHLNFRGVPAQGADADAGAGDGAEGGVGNAAASPTPAHQTPTAVADHGDGVDAADDDSGVQQHRDVTVENDSDLHAITQARVQHSRIQDDIFGL